MCFHIFFDRTVLPFSCFLISGGSFYTVGKILEQVSDVLWSKLSSKHVAVPDHDRFLDIAVKFRERRNFLNVIDCVD